MNKDYELDTIAAISSPIGMGAIGIVRLSGIDAISIVDKIFKARSGKSLKKARNFSITYGTIYNADKIIDEVLIMLMKAPKTYTREDIVEINCHSGLATLKRILNLLIENGARLAEPGEFTKRAFLNGRIDLAEAEAVLDVISSRTERSLNNALKQLGGNLSKRIEVLKNEILDILMHLEASIDFSEEDIKPNTARKISKGLDIIIRDIDSLIETSLGGIISRFGVKCAITGKPNVGKSSLMNLILRKERSIVSDIPGTTRDTIEESANIKGVPVNFIDTAGIAQSKCIIEKEGIRRSKDSINEADIVIYIFDGSKNISKADEKIIRELAGKKVIAVINKMDLPKQIDTKKAKRLLPSSKIIELSALSGKNFEKLEDALKDVIFEGVNLSKSEDVVISNLRHKHSLLKTKNNLLNAKKALKEKLSAEFVSADLNEAIRDLNEIIGESVGDDILERIFDQFCVGK